MADFPTPLEIKALAEDYGYIERREEASSTLFFKESNAANTANSNPSCPILVNVFYTTRGIMTHLPHPTQGYNSLWRSSAYDSLETLAMLFEDPRMHTGKGYRQAKDAVRGCARCGAQRKRTEYSANQWKAGPGRAVCSRCVNGKTACGGGGGGGDNNEGLGGNITKKKSNGNDNRANVYGESFPPLSEGALEEHNKQTSKETIKAKNGKVERRQFNCPLCPQEGRGKNAFFKRVPTDKPICKCPKCKKVKRGDCERLYPIPKGEEKGYGHFRCGECKNTWGSSRAIMNIGQQCQVCDIAGKPDLFVRPFRIEVYRSGGKNNGIAGGGARPAGRNMRRVPREPIGEEEEDARHGYSATDRMRFQNGGSNSLDRTAGGGGGYESGGGGQSSFVWEEVERPEDAAPPASSRLSQYKTAARHKCEGCSTGICRRRKMPISGIHDLHDGDTVSTSGSIITNSEIDKSEFVDRDIDFDDWEDDDNGDEVWVTFGKSGKMLRG
mmetsp:Transcript_26057/g.62563  ORF Transcript_26057/g.62563 Transcript_26057/m.62563 type:complete len:497 (-) Transcript_26057:222-1712(-)